MSVKNGKGVHLFLSGVLLRQQRLCAISQSLRALTQLLILRAQLVPNLLQAPLLL